METVAARLLPFSNLDRSAVVRASSCGHFLALQSAPLVAHDVHGVARVIVPSQSFDDWADELLVPPGAFLVEDEADAAGHAVGDILAAEFSARIQTVPARRDVVARATSLEGGRGGRRSGTDAARPDALERGYLVAEAAAVGRSELLSLGVVAPARNQWLNAARLELVDASVHAVIAVVDTAEALVDAWSGRGRRK